MSENVYIKNYSTLKRDPTRFGGGNNFLFETELEAYKRLSGLPHFPELLDFNLIEMSLTLSFVGQALFNVKKVDIPDNNYTEQADNIVQTLKEKRIVYMDMSERNICYKDNQIYLIDFEGSVFDDTPTNAKTEELYNKFHSRGGYNKLLQQMKRHIEVYLQR